VLRKFAEDEGIEISPDDVRQELDSILATATEENIDAMRRYLSSESALNSIHSSLFNRRVMQRLTEIVRGPSEDAGTAELEAGGDPEAVEAETTSETEASN
jgi:FKBP-type peptidyl-prolyl cis-trans isomerase (trigger factor)